MADDPQITWILENYRAGKLTAAELTQMMLATAGNTYGDIKPGWRTSQFWVCLGGAALGVLAMIGQFATGNSTAQTVGAIGAVALPALYQVTRSSLQKAQLKGSPSGSALGAVGGAVGGAVAKGLIGAAMSRQARTKDENP